MGKSEAHYPYGVAGLEWLARLPSLVADTALQWPLTAFVPFTPLSYNYAAPAVRADGTDVVLKVGFPPPKLFAELLGSMAAPVLLHGDLHHGNILAAERQPWLALDPKGVIGEPAYEVGAWLRNPWPGLLAGPHPRQILVQRVAQFVAELGCDRARIVGWGRAQAVLSAWWNFEDHGDGWAWGMACAELLAALGRVDELFYY